MNLEQTVTTQRVRIEELEEELRQTREALSVSNMRFPHEWNLTPAQQRLLLAFAKNPFLTHEQCFLAVAKNRQVDGDGLVKVQITKLRHKVKPLGMTIVNRWGEGYEMTEESIALLRSSMVATS